MKLSRLIPLSALAFLFPLVPTASALPPWVSAVAHPFPVAQAVVLAGDDGLLYIFGGYSGGQALNTARSYDPMTDIYTDIANMPNALRGACGAKLPDGRLVILGGFSNGQESFTQIYDPMADTWAQGATQAAGWECATAVDDAGMIHLFGGEGATGSHTVYDDQADVWMVAPGLPNSRKTHGAAAGNDGRLYVFGGDDSLNTLDIFDPNDDSWTVGATMPGDNQQFSWESDGANIYVFGGSTSYGNNQAPYFNSVWIYDVANDTWQVDTESLVVGARETYAAIDSMGLIHVFGGSDGNFLDAHQTSQTDIDADDDGVIDPDDNCVDDPNPNQEDADMDGIGDVCDACPDDPDNDIDADMICGDVDNCPDDPNDMQEDADADGVGDICDACPDDPDNDADADLICGDIDNCPDDANDMQEDADADGVGDVCDLCPDDPDNDIDQDNVCGDVDNCPDDANEDQEDADDDGIGDACDDDPGTTTGDDTTGTTGDDTSGTTDDGSSSSGGASDTGTGPDPTDSTAGPTSSTGGTTDGDTDSDSDSAGSGAEEEGCGCRADEQDSPTGGFAALVLLGLVARRRRRT